MVVIEQTIPWRAWQNVYAEPASLVAADHGAAVALLQTLSSAYDAENVPLEVCNRLGTISVRATSRIPARELMLAPSVANVCSLVRPGNTTPANAVDVCVKLIRSPFTAHGATSQEQPLEPTRKKQKKSKKNVDAEKKADTDEDFEPGSEELSSRYFKLLPEWKVPALKRAVEKATQE